MKNYKLQITGDQYRVTSFLENLIENETSPLNGISGLSVEQTTWGFVEGDSNAELALSCENPLSEDVILLIKESYGVEAKLELVGND